MTRINCGIPVEELSDKHLLSEAREIKRVPNAVAKGKCNLNNLPKEFKMGVGHVRFFYDKLLYLLNRYKQLHAECLKRGFKVQDWSSAWDNVPGELMNDYQPTEKDVQLVRERIRERTENTQRFVGPNGEFVPTVQPPEGTMSLQYLEELMEWLYYHDNITEEEKLKQLLNIEKIAADHLKKLVRNCVYKPTWSVKLLKTIKLTQ